MKIGIVCPYSFEVPGGVQFHVRDLAEELGKRGHTVSVLAPVDDATESYPWLVDAGRSVAVPYNGSVARLNFGVRATRAVNRWLEQGDFDIVHIHEPITPSIGILALRAVTGPVVGTFHTAMDTSRARQLATPLVAPLMEKFGARIAVSAEARRTLIQYQGGDAAIVPNGVVVDDFASAALLPAWQGTPQRPVVAFLGRLDEPRKGLAVLAGAIEPVLRTHPTTRFLIAGRGQASEIRAALGRWGDNVEFLGGITDAEKAALLKGADLYIAPQTGGESFGIVLVEAMAAGTLVVASDIAAFSAVLGDGRYGLLFSTGDSAALARQIQAALTDRPGSAKLAAAGQVAAGQYDWSVVTTKVLDVYELAIQAHQTPVAPAERDATLVGRLRSRRQR
ncbi:glycosyltransferase family 4 protein [Buchananella hordeovulneris]|uniref:Alpha-(1-2)-phosphatidylinositol mannosyltransferase n=1 Tax=Buchananella hordeovulneris TaxID=52770 RepID=A0A1Q5PYB9_9ACTO|nr:glycosyltransferase family 4 protein [Buchananella hordeovulneris]OKL52462.1 alpha-(1-2)-phosphatidylinositol mannosyltransferase [Buchananella hordeovulneris]RRD45345.1 glycosyltransferase family 1 protein [Buchananella hordeovulneris]RRD53893.1 glycosyltransferase family 1 protein [Buchananella hordeovulneris]